MYVPESAAPQQFLRLDDVLFHPDGPFPLQDAWRAIDATLSDLRSTKAETTLIVEDSRKREGVGTAEPWLQDDTPSRIIFSGDTVMRWRPVSEGTTRETAEFIGNTRPGENTFVLVGVKGFKSSEQLSAQRVEQLAESVVAVLVGAYDAVCYVLWRLGEAPQESSERN